MHDDVEWMTAVVDDLEDLSIHILALIELTLKQQKQIKELQKKINIPDCFHRFEKRTDVVYLTFPIQYKYKCVDCGHEKSGI